MSKPSGQTTLADGFGLLIVCMHGAHLVRDGLGMPWYWKNGPCKGCAKNSEKFAEMLSE